MLRNFNHPTSQEVIKSFRPSRDLHLSHKVIRRVIPTERKCQPTKLRMCCSVIQLQSKESLNLKKFERIHQVKVINLHASALDQENTLLGGEHEPITNQRFRQVSTQNKNIS